MNLDFLNAPVSRPRRKVLCVRPKLNSGMSSLMSDVMDNWIVALAQQCDLTVIEEDFDFKDVCDRIEPDFVVFEAISWTRLNRLNITRIDAYPHIPRTMNLNCDPHEPLRPLTMQLVHDMGVDTLFSYTGMHFRHFADEELTGVDCIPVKGILNDTVFHDYDEEKTVPVCILSAHLTPSFYPWRAQITQEIQFIFPTYIDLHPGYFKNGAVNPFEVRRERYARQIARSWFAVADTTRLDYLVGKHLEIPACGTVLVAPESEVMTENGFVDLENCILGSGPELYSKMLSVARNRNAYDIIRRRGQQHVLERFNRANWTDLIDWYECRRLRQPGEVTKRNGLYGTFRNEPAGAPGAWRDNPMGTLMRRARDIIIEDGDYSEAVGMLSEISSWVGHIAEPRLMRGVIYLLEGDLQQAIVFCSMRSNAFAQESSTLATLDPCEAAWLILLATMIGDMELRAQMIAHSENSPHVSIRRMLWLTAGPLGDDRPAGEDLLGPMPGDCISIYWLGQESLPQWLDLIARIFVANGMEAQAQTVRAFRENHFATA